MCFLSLFTVQWPRLQARHEDSIFFQNLEELRSLGSQDRWNEVEMSTRNLVKGVSKGCHISLQASKQHAVHGSSTQRLHS